MATETLSPMQQQILDRADAIFASIGTAVGKATDFASEQIPDIALQYILYNRVYLTSVVVGTLLLFILHQVTSITLCRKRDKALEEASKYNDEGHWLAYGLSTLVLSIITLFAVLCNFSDMLKVWFAPKIFLIEQVVHLAKSLH